MRKALKDTKVHGYLDVTVVYGRKPGGGSDVPEVEAEPFDEIGFGHVEEPGTSTTTAPVVMDVSSTTEPVVEPTVGSILAPTGLAEVEMAGMTEPTTASMPSPTTHVEMEMVGTTELVTEPTRASELAPVAEPMEIELATTTEPVRETPVASTPSFTTPIEIDAATATEPMKKIAVESTSIHTAPEEVDTVGATEPMKEFTVESTSVPITELMAEFTAPTTKNNEPLMTPMTEDTENPVAEPVLKTAPENLP